MLPAAEVSSGIEDLHDAEIERVSHVALLHSATHFGAAMSGYDALYAALADSLDATLVTGDRRLAVTAADQFGLRVLAV